MKLCVLALDYDGTTAINDTMDSGIRVAGSVSSKRAPNMHIASLIPFARATSALDPLQPRPSDGAAQSHQQGDRLREALTILRLSPRSTIGFGDAENDHELLRACEVGVAVGWGSQSLRAVADEVVEGSGPAALVPYLQRLVTCGQLPPSERRGGSSSQFTGSRSIVGRPRSGEGARDRQRTSRPLRPDVRRGDPLRRGGR